MKATLIYNESAGNGSTATADEIQDALYEVGYDPVYKPTETIADIGPILEDVSGLVISAGGDGSAREIIIRLIGREDVYFTPLPMGTANNVCKTLGINGKPLEIIKGLGSPISRRFDVGQVTAPWGEGYFVEGAGIGFFAEILASYEPEKGKSVLRSAKSLIDIIQNGFARETTIYLPEQEVHGEFLLVEALNMTAVGPRLKFAPDADPSDGLLNVVCIRSEHREGYLTYLSSILTEEMSDLDSVETYQVPEFKMKWHGFPVHLDAEVFPPDFDYRKETEEKRFTIRPYPDLPEDAMLHIRNLHHSIHAWLPNMEDED